MVCKQGIPNEVLGKQGDVLEPHEAVTLRICASGSGRGVEGRDCRLVESPSAGAMLKRAVCALAAHDAIDVSRFRGDPSVYNKRTGVSEGPCLGQPQICVSPGVGHRHHAELYHHAVIKGLLTASASQNQDD